MQATSVSYSLPDGRTISIETGRLAKQADGSVVVRCGDTMLMANIVSNPDVDGNIDFLPLMVDYKENYSATGRIPGGFLKREGRPSDHEVLICRLVDRALRPMFPSDYHSNTIVTLRLLSSDQEQMPDSLACLAASAAIMVSDIPFAGPISEVRVGRMNGEWIINPGLSQMEELDIELMVAATKDSVVMVEGEMKEVSEDELVEAIEFGHDAIKQQIAIQEELSREVGRSVRTYQHETQDDELKQRIHDACYADCRSIAEEGIADKAERSARFAAVKDAFIESMSEEETETKGHLVGGYFKAAMKAAVRDVILEKRTRLDGRAPEDVRPIWGEVDYLPHAHGSAIFTRGETQSLTTVTLGAKADEQMIDGAFIKGYSRLMLHYNFPSFSTGEARMPRGTSRREVGHGNLALRALKGTLPEEQPYTIRIVSDILESNGSSSMATVCAGSLALMDAGIQVKSGVSGIAMGLITGADGEFAVLSDILGDEDFLGDMDFKVAGTPNGITAVQMDIKIEGLSYEILGKALHQSREGRAHILGEMNKVLDAPRPELKPHAPAITEIKIDQDQIGGVIGPGGKIIKEIQAESGATVNVSEDDEFGYVQIFADNQPSMDEAVRRVQAIVAKPEVGEVYDSVVKSVMDYGLFVEFMPGNEGLLHISQISWSRLDKIQDAGLKEGDQVKVKLTGIDERGRVKLSRKVLLPKPEKQD